MNTSSAARGFRIPSSASSCRSLVAVALDVLVMAIYFWVVIPPSNFWGQASIILLIAFNCLSFNLLWRYDVFRVLHRQQRNALFDTVHFPQSIEKYPFTGKGYYLLKGTVLEDFGVPSLDVSNMQRIPWAFNEN